MLKVLLSKGSFLLSGLALASVRADTLEENMARLFVRNYKQNEARLEAIDAELDALPRPYMREPTGTGGYLTHAQASSTNSVIIRFNWPEPVEIDAVALFPLRLFMDEIYGENLYWPGSVTIEAETDGEIKTVAQYRGDAPLIRQSLPKLVAFEPLTTQRLFIRCTDLPRHPHEDWYAAGFAEICVFSGFENVAPRAASKATQSRQGYHVLAKEFLTDLQTPLGLPELSSPTETHDFIKVMHSKQRSSNRRYALTLTYPEDILIDGVRIDPAIEHSYGQSFPVRFRIELLDARGRVVQSDQAYENFPLRPPGLNPHFAYFPETTARSVRLTVLGASQPVPKATPAIAFSEITALHNGLESARATRFEEVLRAKKTILSLDQPHPTKAQQLLAAANDGQTHSGRVLPLRDWIVGLTRRQALLEEQFVLNNRQQKSLKDVGYTLIYGSLSLLIIVIGSAVYFIVRNRLRVSREIRSARARMASDLHDDVGSNLGAIVLHVEKLQETQPEPADYDRLHSILRLTRESVFGLREVLRTTAPEVGRAQDIVAYMRELAGLLLGKTRFTFKADPSINPILQEHAALQKGLLLFYKEAVHNAKTHAECSHVDISFTREGQALVLRVCDDGRGMDEQALNRPRTLRTLKQRADWLHADLEIKSSPGKGTQLRLSVEPE